MLHINTETKPPVLAAGGSPIDIATDICYAIGKLYSAMNRMDKHSAKILQSGIIAGLGRPDAPTWSIQPLPGEIAVATRIPGGGE